MKRYTLILCFLPLLFLGCPQKGKVLPVAWELFPGEEQAVRQMLKSESLENISRLAHIRYQYASRFLKYADENQDAEALELAAWYAESAADLMPDIADYHALVALVYTGYGPAAEARLLGLAAAARALEVDTAHKDALLIDADLAFKDGLWARAADDLERLFLFHPDIIGRNTVSLYVQALNADQTWTHGIEFLTKIIDLKELAVLRAGRGILLFAKGQVAEALADIDRALVLAGNDKDLISYLRALSNDMAKGVA